MQAPFTVVCHDSVTTEDVRRGFPCLDSAAMFMNGKQVRYAEVVLYRGETVVTRYSAGVQVR